MSLEAQRIQTTLTQNGTLTLDHQPLQAGEIVEVIVLANVIKTLSPDPYPLHGTAVQYHHPMESVAEQDWIA